MNEQRRINDLIRKHPMWRLIINGVEIRGLDGASTTVVLHRCWPRRIEITNGEKLVDGVFSYLVIEDNEPPDDGRDCISCIVDRWGRDTVAVTLEPEYGLWYPTDDELMEARTTLDEYGEEHTERRLGPLGKRFVEELTA